MVKEAEDAVKAIEQHFDRAVRDLSQIDYREVLEEVISNLESRLDCVKQELEAEGEIE